MSEDRAAPRRVPVPPFELAHRVMAIDREAAEETYRAHGEGVKAQIVSLLSPDWTFDGKRVLDFGCGAGRVMGAFLDQAERAEFHGCDIDAESVAWMKANLSPPFHVFANTATPSRLPFDDDSLDLIYAVSVFSHLTDGWSGWLAELHRCLAPDGFLLATFLGEASSETVAGEPWDPDQVAMNVLFPDQPWERGGPMVFVSEWWLRAHWGRAFELERHLPATHPSHQDWGVFRPKRVEATAALLEEPEPDEPREVRALRHNLVQLRREHRAEIAGLRQAHSGLAGSVSWRLTKPLRSIKRGWRRLRGV